MEPFHQFVRIFLVQAGEKSVIKREKMEKKSAGLVHLRTVWVTEDGTTIRDG